MAENAGIEGTAGLLERPPSCTGVEVTPADNLQAVISEEDDGATFCLQGGTYEPSKKIIPKNHDSFIGAESGVVFDGKEEVDFSFYGYGRTHGAYVTVENIAVKGFTKKGIYLEQHAIVNHVELRENTIGIWLSQDSKLEHSYIHDNTQYGMTGGPGPEGEPLTVENNDFYHNNTSEYCGGKCAGDAGMSKFVGPEQGFEIVMTHNYIHGNIGNGIWEDIGDTGSRIEWNVVTNNTKIGIFIEVSSNADIKYNTMINNDQADVGGNCGDGSQIQVSDSTNVEIFGNTVKAANGANGICGYDSNRDPEAEAGVKCPCSDEVKELYVYSNTVYMREGARTGLGGRKSAGEGEAGNSFSKNSYFLAHTEGEFWTLPSGKCDWEVWQAVGQDPEGRLHAWE